MFRAIAVVVGMLLIGIISKTIVYRLFFHPLRSFPGRWINGISSLPAALALVRGRQHTYYHELHQEFGPVVRVSPDELSFTSSQAFEDIYGFRRELNKSPIYASVARPRGAAVSIGQATGKDHARLRKELAPGFTKTALRDHRDQIQRCIDTMLQSFHVESAKECPIPISRWYTYLTFDCTGEVCFSEVDGCLDQRRETEWCSALKNVVFIGTLEQAFRKIAGVNTWFCWLLMKLLPAQTARWKEIHFQKTQEKTLRRLSKGESDRHDITYHILKDKNTDKDTGLSPMETVLNMCALIAAGTLTTSVLLTTWTYLLCTHPEEYAKLTKEIREYFPAGKPIEPNHLMNLPYLSATIHETLRLFPPASINLQRETPPDGAIVDGCAVPPTTTVSVAPWAAARSAHNFTSPNEFRPERWLDNESGSFSKDDLRASKPFSLGSRVCIGQDLALLEAKLTIVRLLLDFDIELDHEGEAGLANETWSLDPFPQSIKSAQIMLLPDLWVRLRERTPCSRVSVD